jgi:hypothetical protein
MTTTTLAAPTDDLERSEWRRLAPLAGAFLASGVLLALAEWMAARGDTRAHFYVFWVAYFLVVAPVAWNLVAERTSAALRGTLVVALGIWSLAPTLLRTGNDPLFFDEFSHFRMLQDLVRTGHPVSSVGLLQIGANFPGLELVTSGLYHLSGLTLWLAALVIAGTAHVALLTGVYVLVKDATRSTRAAAVAAIVYSLNPSWLVFDAQFSYETLALPMLVWALVFALRAMRRRSVGAGVLTRNVEVGVAALLAAGLVVTHSVTSFVCAVALVGVAIVATLQRRGPLRSDVATSIPIAWGLAGWSVVVTAWRFVVVGHPLLVYLGPTFRVSQQLRQLLSLLGIGSGLPLHSAFAGSSAPFFEVVCAYLMLPVLLVAFVWAVWGLVGARHELSPLVYVAVGLAALFFVSLPLASAVAYSEAVHRSWAFSFLGFAVVLGVALGLALDGRLTLTARRHRLWPPAARVHRALLPVLAAGAVVVAIGATGLGSSTAYRFGGAVVGDVDPLYVGTQTQMVARWFASNATAHDVVFANRFVIRPIAVASRVAVVPPGGTEVHLLLTRRISPDELFAYYLHRVTYVVYDRRMVGAAKAWFWYVPSDSLLPDDARGGAYVTRLGCLNWLHAVFATSDYEVLRVDRATLHRDLLAGSTGLDRACAAVFGG